LQNSPVHRYWLNILAKTGDSDTKVGINTVKSVNHGLWNMMVPETAPNEIMLDHTKGIAQVQKDYDKPSVPFLCISKHVIEQLSVFQDTILAVGKTFLNIVIVVVIVI